MNEANQLLDEMKDVKRQMSHLSKDLEDVQDQLLSAARQSEEQPDGRSGGRSGGRSLAGEGGDEGGPVRYDFCIDRKMHR